MALDEMFGQFRGKSQHLYPVKHLQEKTDRASQTNSGTGGNALANPDSGTRAIVQRMKHGKIKSLKQNHGVGFEETQNYNVKHVCSSNGTKFDKICN